MTQQIDPSEVARIFDAETTETAGDLPPRYNLAPTDPVTAVLERDDGRFVETLRWGLIPAWAESPAMGSRMINARAETVASSPAFRVALRRRRCIVPVDGFYEWQRLAGRRTPQPWLIRRRDGGPLAFAGLWSPWRDPATGEWLSSCAVITTQANRLVEPLHHRMPVVLAESDWRDWLDADSRAAGALLDLLHPSPADDLTLHPVSTRVNSVRNQGPELVVPIEL